ncbi:hypothetical protein OJ997_02915 [Solirubrobacter phytolaccae]|uniref:Uncharacterized protein n=1 Tax=Solirubrobacter phytolaccae TaxID=1404360 RepID=A0A9X3N6A9_9ACTN|nr:hypothetical protein [Solirubrobacter phytolaccae]MDA0179235.1 hypothetical protein [Solirubrobacter phytolaccae]
MPSVSFPRPLSPPERAALRDLIERAGVPERDVLLAQVDAAEALSGCACPCPTISLRVDPTAAEPVEYTAKPIATADYDDGAVMVWVEDGWLSHLELTWYVADPPPSAFPPPTSMSNHRVG